MRKKRIEWLDIARGITILAVVIGHTFQSQTFSMQTLPAKIIFAFHMPLFFIVSGYLFHQQRLRIVLRKGIRSLLVPYLGTSGIFIIAFVLAKFNILPDIFFSPFHDIRQLVVSILYGFGGGPFGTVNPFGWNIALIGIIWFLLAMFWTNLIFQAIYQYSKRYSNCDVVLAIFVSIIVVIGINLARLWILPLALDSAFLAVAFFYVGYLLQKIDLEALIRQPMIIFVMLLLWLVSAKNGLFQMSAISYIPSGNFLTAIIGGVSGTLVIFALSMFLKRFSRIKKTLSLLGRRSLVMMCFHAIDVGTLTISSAVLASTVNYPRAIVFIALMLARLITPIVFTLGMPYIPGLRAIYLPRRAQKRTETSQHK
ncbi:acyltransferase family protein [Furfurilactobacillus rossiae]|uniref:O-acetyltransferase n=1 Tax=Furfurilactobacillus rossiae DSM 15814 TaxID=1114972 RepID=A0A0R1RCF9_9LACO|nr:acyltransferase family protein [Furfurilactobacillus rossiae]KRL52474.1 o-acetyltransferase [Furfurilactobacillus rossiae DSM 15814]QFR67972.1 acyltransferase family protein [Furfurilactobacillus rossiae]QLE60961.1 O-acetyltransferase [Furfurilactobacillus rossiae]